MQGVNRRMRVDARVEDSRLTFTITAESDDVLRGPRRRLRVHYGGPPPATRARVPSIWLVRRTCTFELPSPWRLDDVHPDTLALAIAFLVFPFARARLRVPRAVSSQFAREFEALTALRVEPTGAVGPQNHAAGGRTGLAFSGGVDSTASVALLPEGTALVHLLKRRPGQRAWKPTGLPMTQGADAALNACRVMAREGREVVVVPTDMEYLTAPVGFPTQLAVGVPLLLLSAALGLKVIAFGTVMESAYGISYGRFRDFVESDLWRRPEALYRSAGVRYAPVTAGLSEVATTRIVRSLPYGDIARSCVRGKVEPCGRCVKCFRKELVAMALDGHFDDARLGRALSSAPVIRELLAQPIHHANVYTWAAQRYTGALPEVRALRHASGDPTQDLTWTERWYPPAAELLPESLRASVIDAATRLVGPMTAGQIARAQSFGVRSPQQLADSAASVRAALWSSRRRRFLFAAHEAADPVRRLARRLGLKIARWMALSDRPR